MTCSKIKIACVVILALLFEGANGDTKTDLIYTGIDTILAGAYLSAMDFVIQRPCTSAEEKTCNAQIVLGKYGPAPEGLYYALGGTNCWSIDLGKVNLDSVKASPSDSELINEIVIFRIFPDSLNSCIGNVYVVKTGDARNTGLFSHPLRVKLKILDFDVLDTASYHIQMIFLWMANMGGNLEMVTPEPLDTFSTLPGIFDAEGTVVQSREPIGSFAARPTGVTVSPRLMLPPLSGSRAGVVVCDRNGGLVWDLNGRRVRY
jgi:hypothetical protein